MFRYLDSINKIYSVDYDLEGLSLIETLNELEHVLQNDNVINLDYKACLDVFINCLIMTEIKILCKEKKEGVNI